MFYTTSIIIMIIMFLQLRYFVSFGYHIDYRLSRKLVHHLQAHWVYDAFPVHTIKKLVFVPNHATFRLSLHMQHMHYIFISTVVSLS